MFDKETIVRPRCCKTWAGFQRFRQSHITEALENPMITAQNLGKSNLLFCNISESPLENKTQILTSLRAGPQPEDLSGLVVGMELVYSNVLQTLC